MASNLFYIVASQQDKCGPSHDQECCYLKSKCQGTPGKYGRGYRIRTCGDMYAPPGKFLLADPDVPCGLDCEKCFADDNGGDDGWFPGGGFPFNDDGPVVVHG